VWRSGSFASKLGRGFTGRGGAVGLHRHRRRQWWRREGGTAQMCAGAWRNVSPSFLEPRARMMMPAGLGCAADPRGRWPRRRHYEKTSNRSHNICNGHLTPVTSTHICNGCVWRPLPIIVPGRPRGWPQQLSLPMWTSGNELLKCPLHKFFVTDVKRACYKCQTYR
jgi:hypothetical protein